MDENSSLHFPVQFDLEAGVDKAIADIPAVLSKLEKAINARPLKVNVGTDIDTSSVQRQLDDMRKSFDDMVRRGVAINPDTGNLSRMVENLLSKFNEVSKAAEATAASVKKSTMPTDGVSDDDLAKLRDKTDSLAVLNEQLKIRNKLLAEAPRTIDGASNPTWENEKRAVDELTAKIKALKAEIKLPNQDMILAMPENSFNDIDAKMKSLRASMKSLDYGSEEMVKAQAELERLTALKKQWDAALAQADALRNWEASLLNVAATMGNMSNVVSNLRNALNQTTIGTEQWHQLADAIATASQQMKKAQQWANDYKQPAFLGLGDQRLDQVAALHKIRQEIEQLDIAQNKLNANKQLYDANGGLTSEGVENARQRADAMQRMAEVLRTADDAQKAYNDTLAKQAAIDTHQANLNLNPQTITEYQSKISALQQELNNLKPADANFAKFADDLQKSKAGLNELQQAIEGVKHTIGSLNELNAKLAEHQSKLQSLNAHTSVWEQEALAVRKLQNEIEQINARLADYNQKAFAGLGDATLTRQAEEFRRLRATIAEAEEQFNRLRAAGRAYDSEGNLTAIAVAQMDKRNNALQEQAKLIVTLDQAEEQHKRKLAEEEAELQRLIATEQKRKRHVEEMRQVFAANEQRMQLVNDKLQAYQSLIQGLRVGDMGWNKAASEIARLTAELDKATARMRDFQQEAFKGLSHGQTESQVAQLTNLRKEMADVDARMNERNMFIANGNTSPNLRNEQMQDADRRLAIVREINQITKTAADYALEREKQVTAELERQRKIAEQRQNKTKQNDFISGRTGGTSIDAIEKRLAYWRNIMNNSQVGGTAFKTAAEHVRVLSDALNRARAEADRLSMSTEQADKRAAKQASEQKQRLEAANKLLRNQYSYVDRLVQRMAVYASFAFVGAQLNKLREVTAQFELQRISLGAILQNQQKADRLFSDIKSFAVQSPVTIMDLTKYTKQLAAYRIESDKLFDTTKRLTDVAVGLGVGMDRVVLAYGQVKATGWLRASEIRQFTEMGVPIVEELAAKLSKMNNELVTSRQVMKMVEDRAISFKLVEEVFDDMTSAGGVFYNMQIKQGDTLYGQFAKLCDAIDIMYDKIGNTGLVHGAMTTFVTLATSLARAWEGVGVAIGIAAAGYATIKAGRFFAAMPAKGLQLQQTELERLRAKQEIARYNLDRATAVGDNKGMSKAQAQLDALDKKITNAGKSMGKFKAATSGLVNAFGGLWNVGIMVFAAIAGAIWQWYQNSVRLSNALNEIRTKFENTASAAQQRFTTLANTAVTASAGSKQQREALEELQRTYGDIIPQEMLTIENLSAMAGKYDKLTEAIRQYHAEKAKEEALNKLEEEEGKSVVEAAKEFQERISATRGKTSYGAYSTPFHDKDSQRRISENVRTAIEQGYSVEQAAEAALRLEGEAYLKFTDYIAACAKDFAQALRDYKKQAEDINRQFSDTAALGQYEDAYYNLVNGFKDMNIQSPVGSWIAEIETANKKIDRIAAAAAQAMDKEFTQQFNRLLLRSQDLSKVCGKNWDMIIAAYDDPEAKAKLSAVRDKYTKIWKGSFLASGINPSQVDNDIFKALFDTYFKEWKKEYGQFVTDINNEGKYHKLDFEKMLNDSAGDPTLFGYIKRLQGEVEKTVPNSSVTQTAKDKFVELANAAKISMDNVRSVMIGSDQTFRDYYSSLKKTLKDMEDALREFGTVETMTKADGVAQQKAKDKAAMAKAMIAWLEQLGFADSDNKAKGEDTRISRLQEMNTALTSLHKQYVDFAKVSNDLNANDFISKFKPQLEEINKLGAKFGLTFDTPKTLAELNKYREQIIAAMRNVPKSDKAVVDLSVTIAKDNTDELVKAIEKQLKDVAEKVSQTKAAKEFFDKVLSETGDAKLAETLSKSLHGLSSGELFKAQAEQIKMIFSPEVEADKGKWDKELEQMFNYDTKTIDYGKLLAFYKAHSEEIIEARRDTAKTIVTEGAKGVAEEALQLEKSLAKAKDYEAQRTEIMRKGEEERKKIANSTIMGDDVKLRLTQQSRSNEKLELNKVNIDELKNSNIYVRAFANLDNVSRRTLTMVKQRLQAIIDLTKNTENTEGLKSLVEALEKVDKEFINRSPLNAIEGGFKRMLSGKTNKATADDNLLTATEARKRAEDELAILQASEVKNEELIQLTTEKVGAAKKKEVKAQEQVAEAQDEIIKGQNEVYDGVRAMCDGFNSAADVISEIADKFKFAEDSEAQAIVNGLVSGLKEASSVMSLILTTAILISAQLWWLTAIGAAVAAIGAAWSYFSGADVRKANKEIEAQEQSIKALERAYKSLQEAEQQAFGSDYIYNYNRQLEVLRAKATAYIKQRNAENAKGKDKDADKVEEYYNNYLDTLDEIDKMQHNISKQMLGADLSSAARDFAKAWLDAYMSFSNTATAMQGKFKDMLHNMIAESVIAKVMEQALKPAFDMIDGMKSADFHDASFWEKLLEEMNKGVTAADTGARNAYAILERAGINASALNSNLTGITRNIANASEDSINGLATAMEAQNYHIRSIASDVRALRTSLDASNADDDPLNWRNWQAQSLNGIHGIERNTAEIVAECRNAVAQCKSIANDVHRVIDSAGGNPKIRVKL